MFTELKIKRICNSFKAPDIEIPLLSAKVAKRPRLKPALATAALALVIVGASVVGIKGNIFKGDQPLPPVDIDTPDTPDTPTPPDTDTPTPPEDDVKIIYDEKTNFTGGGLATALSKRLFADERLLTAMDSEKYKDCKFAVYLMVTDGNNSHYVLYETSERYKLLYDIESACKKLSSEVKYYFQNFRTLTEDDREKRLDSIFDKLAASGLTAEQYKRKFGENAYVSFEVSSQQIIAGIEQYTEKFGDDFFQNDELEMVKEFLSLTREDFYNEETVELYETFSRVYSGDWHWRKYKYTESITNKAIEYFKSFGVEIRPADTEKLRKVASDPLDIYEAVLTKEELYALAEALEKDYAKTGIGYGVQTLWRGE